MNVPFVKVNNQQEFDRVVDKMQRETGLQNPYNYSVRFNVISLNSENDCICGWQYVDDGILVISADEYLTGIRANFTLSDLEDGMVVELRNYEELLYLVLFNKILGLDTYDDLEEYNEDFTAGNSELDIVKIYSIVDVKSLSTNLSKDNLILIFDAEAHRNKLAIEQKKIEIQSKIAELNKQLEELK